MMVYVMQCVHTDVYKIGISQRPDLRLRQLESTENVELRLVLSFPMFLAGSAEFLLHKHFRQKRLMGEWFQLTQEDVEGIKLLAKRLMRERCIRRRRSRLRGRGRPKSHK